MDPRIALEVGREGLGVLAFGEVVDLLERRDCELLDQRVHVSSLAHGLVSLQPTSHTPESREVHVHDLLDVGALDFHDDLLEAVDFGLGSAQSRPMHLAERCGGHRLFVDPLVARRERLAELCLGLLADGGELLGRDFVLEPRELVGDLGRKYVEASREELPDLDHQPAHADGERAESHGDASRAIRARAGAPATEADARQEDLPPDEARGDPGEEQDDSPVPGAKLRVLHVTSVVVLERWRRTAIPHARALATTVGVRCPYSNDPAEMAVSAANVAAVRTGRAVFARNRFGCGPSPLVRSLQLVAVEFVLPQGAREIVSERLALRLANLARVEGRRLCLESLGSVARLGC